MKYFVKLRGKLSHKLLNFLINKRIDNKIILIISVKIYEILNWKRYINSHKDENSHFIPRFLLKKFKIGSTGCIYEYKTGRMLPKSASIRKTAALPNLYTFKDKEKGKSDFIEKELFANLLEKYTPPILKRIEDHNFPLTSVEESMLSAFVASLYTRNPKFLRQLRDVVCYLMVKKNVDPKNLFKDRDFVRKVFLDNSFDINRKKLRNFFRKFKKTLDNDDLILTISLRITEILQEIIYCKNLTFLQVENPDFLFITDNPVLAFSFSKKQIVGSMIWEIKENSIIMLPFSPTTSLIYADRTFNTINDKIFLYNIFWKIYPYNRDELIFANVDSPILRRLV